MNGICHLAITIAPLETFWILGAAIVGAICVSVGTATSLPIEIPRNYYVDDDPDKGVLVRWRAHANLLFSNWLNYFVYQETPYNINEIG